MWMMVLLSSNDAAATIFCSTNEKESTCWAAAGLAISRNMHHTIADESLIISLFFSKLVIFLIRHRAFGDPLVFGTNSATAVRYLFGYWFSCIFLSSAAGITQYCVFLGYG